MSELEKDLEAKCYKEFDERGGIHLKLNVRGRRGWPDGLFIYGKPLKVFMVEFKRVGGKVRKLQHWTIEQIRRRGLDVYICDSYKGFCGILDAKSIPAKRGEAGSVTGIAGVTTGPWTRKD